jgi:2-iminobutanoate/2-iminopropanoate deaminase
MSDLKLIDPSKALPLSAAVIHNGVAYLSGQVGFKPGTTELAGDDVASQARQTMANLDASLASAGTSKQRIIRCNIYVKDILRDFATMNECYVEWLGDHRPARSTIGCEMARDDILIEIDCVAAVD